MTTKPKILVVDDEIVTLALIRKLLSQRDYEVITAPSGVDALILLEQDDDFDVMLLDIMMPDLDGFEVLEMVKANPNTESVKVIMVSALAQEEHKVKTFSAGAADYIVKPFQVGELVARVETQVRLKRTEHALRQSEERYRQLVENASDIIFRTDNTGHVIFCNVVATRVLGYSEGELLGRHYLDFVRPDFRETAARRYGWQYVKKTPNTYYEFPAITKEGAELWLGQNTRLVIERDEVVGFQVIARDVTKRVRTEEALRASEERFRALFEDLPVPCWTFDREGTILVWNRACEALYGWTAEQAVGRTMYELMVKDENVAPTQKKTAAVFEGQSFHRIEYQDLRADGTLCDVLVSEYPLRDATGHVIMGICAKVDITDRKQTEEALRRQLKELTILHAVALAGAEATREDALIERATRLIGETLYPDNFGVLYVDETSGVLYAHPSYRSPEEAKQTPVPLGRGIVGQVAADGETRRIADVTRDPEYLAIDLHTRSELCVPLKIGERVIGVVNAESAQPDAFTEADERLMGTLAGQLATAIEKTRLFEAERTARERTEALYRTARSLIGFESLPSLLQTVTDSVAEALSADRVTLITSDQEARQVTHFVKGGPGADQVVNVSFDELGEGLSGWVLRQGEPALSPKGTPDPRESQEVQQRRAETNCGAIIVVPLWYWGETLGTLTAINRPDQRDFTEQDVALMMAMANQAAIAIENARLFQEAQRRADELSLLFEAARDTSATLKPAEVMHRLAEFMCRAADGTSANVLMLDETGVRATVLAQFSSPEAVPAESEPDVGSVYDLTHYPSILEFVRSGQLTVTHADDVALDAETREMMSQFGGRSAMRIPLLLDGAMRGYVLIWDSRRRHEWSESDVRLCQTLAASTAVALENARLYQETQQRATEMSTLYEVVTAAMTSVRLDEIFQRTIAALQETLQPDDIAILLVDQKTDELVIRASSGFPGGPKLVRRAIGVGIPGWVVQTGQPVNLGDVRDDERYHACDADTRSEMCVPLQVGERIIGALNLESRQVDAFDEQDLRLLSILAGHLAAVVENARLVKGLEAKVTARTAEALAEKEKSDAILRGVGEAIGMSSLERRVEYVNEAFTAMTGYTPQESIGQVSDFVVAEPMPDVDFWALNEALAKGETWRGESIMRRKDGRTYDAAVSIAPMRDAEGRTVGFVSSHRDISPLKELDRARRRFLTNVSHQLRTPVANLKLYTRLLQKDASPDKIGRYLQVLDAQMEQLTHLVQDIVEITTLDSGQVVAVEGRVALPTVIENAVERCHAQIKAADLTLVIAPPPPDLPVVRGAPPRLTQALAELVENAAIFTPAGGRVTVETATTQVDGQHWVTIAVHDTGPGISPEEQTRVFDRFFRGKLAESGHIPGTGLGLSLVDEIMRAHGGQVTVESPSTGLGTGEPGKGSTFTLWLPGRSDGSVAE